MVDLQTEAFPVMVPAGDGISFTVSDKLLSVPSPQLLWPFTLILPEVAVALIVVVIVFVVLVPVMPVGKVHV